MNRSNTRQYKKDGPSDQLHLRPTRVQVSYTWPQTHQGPGPGQLHPASDPPGSRSAGLRPTRVQASYTWPQTHQGPGQLQLASDPPGSRSRSAGLRPTRVQVSLALDHLLILQPVLTLFGSLKKVVSITFWSPSQRRRPTLNQRP